MSVTKELYREPHPTLANRLHNQGFILRNLGKLDGAESFLREALALIVAPAFRGKLSTFGAP